MSDLISRQKALEHLRKRLIQTANNNVGFVCDAGLTFEDASERVKTWLDEVPSIDAVQVVRCKDCKHRYIKNDVWTCPFGLMSGPDGYCSWAERKEE